MKRPQARLNVAAQEANPDSMLHFYRRMLGFRRDHPVLVDGDISFLRTDEPVLAFRRSGPDGSMVCVFNLSPNGVSVTVDGAASAALLPISQGAEIGGTELALGPNGFAFLEERGDSKRIRVRFNRAKAKGAG